MKQIKQSKIVCTHNVDTSEYIPDHQDDEGNNVSGYWVYGKENTTRDIDLHRYTCTQCNAVMYYSNAARKYYEEGVTWTM